MLLAKSAVASEARFWVMCQDRATSMYAFANARPVTIRNSPTISAQASLTQHHAARRFLRTRPKREFWYLTSLRPRVPVDHRDQVCQGEGLGQDACRSDLRRPF